MHGKVRISCQSENCFPRKFDLDIQKEQGNTSSRVLADTADFMISCIRL
ncbi:hypothetical protein HMPREF1986_01690 [Oribacterium sp. oral taxon 078 str. F0263]|nr:hypothetical protein HMPREF1986_01690 [Oribacterium sp. oral taxon 078 str. F0263]